MDERQEQVTRAVLKIEEEVDGLKEFKTKAETTMRNANVFSSIVAFFVATGISVFGYLLGR